MKRPRKVRRVGRRIEPLNDGPERRDRAALDQRPDVTDPNIWDHPRPASPRRHQP